MWCPFNTRTGLNWYRLIRLVRNNFLFTFETFKSVNEWMIRPLRVTVYICIARVSGSYDRGIWDGGQVFNNEWHCGMFKHQPNFLPGHRVGRMKNIFHFIRSIFTVDFLWTVITFLDKETKINYDKLVLNHTMCR